MPKGISLHLGLNKVDPNHYGGWDGTLRACENDAHDTEAIARSLNYETRTVLLTKEATHGAVTGAIAAASGQLRSGDIFLISYSGHGGQVPDRNADEEEDNLDETWVLYDRQLVDDELYALWAGFAPGVRILMLSDSCHSGSAARAALYNRLSELGVRPEGMPAGQVAVRGMPEEVRDKTYEKNRALYDKVQKDYPSAERVGIGASVLLISGCQDNQSSYDGPRNGAFTAMLLKIWNRGEFRGGYRKFYKTILRNMPLSQTPNYFKVGMPNLAFERQRPFTI